MDTIIKASGTPAEILKQLETLRAVFGAGATLSEIATATRYARIKIAINRQTDEGSAGA